MLLVTPEHYQELLLDVEDNAQIHLYVERAQAIVLGYYSEKDLQESFFSTVLTSRIALKGYSEDLDEINPDLLRALRVTISVVARHLANSTDRAVQSFRRGDRAVTFAQVTNTLPPLWDSMLNRFDQRSPLWVI